MKERLPILFLEPAPATRRNITAKRFTKSMGGANIHLETITLDETRSRLKEIRKDSRDSNEILIQELQSSLKKNYPHISFITARDNAEAIDYITGISDNIRLISINNSAVASQELKPSLTAAGFTVFDSYLKEYRISENRFRDYPNLPRFLDKGLLSTFDISEETDCIYWADTAQVETKSYMCLLGVNAISVENTTVLFVQHFSNIRNDLKQAAKVILVVGLDKVVKTIEDAVFQTKCTSIFGIENMLLSMQAESAEAIDFDEIPPFQDNKKRELHVVFLDNGRTDLLKGRFQDLFLCIGCRACNLHCPIRHSFTDVGHTWTPRSYLGQFLAGTNRSVDICLHCQACRLECPVGIDIPYLMWLAKGEYIERHGISFSHKLLGRPETLAKIGTATPLSTIVNLLMKNPPVRYLVEKITGIDRRAELPAFHFNTFRRRLKCHDQ